MPIDTNITYQQNGQYQVHYDKDRDGVVDPNEESFVVDEATLNGEILAALNLQAKDGVFYDNDGVVVSGDGSLIVTDTQPFLPDVGDPQEPGGVLGANDARPLPTVHDGSSLRDTLVWASELQDAALMWASLMEMARGNAEDVRMARKLKNFAEGVKINLKKEEIDATSSRISSERQAAWNKFGTAVGAAVGTAALSLTGAYYSGKGISGYALLTTASAAGTVIQTMGEALDMNVHSGAQHQAQEQQIQEKVLQQMQEVVDQTISDTRSGEDEARAQFKAALDTLTKHFDIMTDINRRVTGISGG